MTYGKRSVDKMGYRIVITANQLDPMIKAAVRVKAYLAIHHNKHHSLPSRPVLNTRAKVIDVCGPKPAGIVLRNMQECFDAISRDCAVSIRIE